MYIYTALLRQINRYIKKGNSKSKVVSPPQLYVHDLPNLIFFSL